MDEIEILWPDPKRLDFVVVMIEEIKEKLLKDSADIIEIIETTTEMYLSLSENKDLPIIVHEENTIEIINLINSNISSIINGRKSLLSNNLIKRIRIVQNQYSIVFQKKQPNKNLLFLGDVSTSNYNKFKSNLINSKYKIIKVSHHGTRDYYVDDLPNSEIMIMSNAKHSNWEISSKYTLKYSNSKFICTNNNGCEVHNIIKMNCEKIKKTLDSSTNEDGKHCGFTGSYEIISL